MISRIKTIGIIAEDNSDFDAVKVIINNITNKNLSYKRNIGNGCGKIKRKCKDYVEDLYNRQCDLVILFHDLDRNNFEKLHNELSEKIKDCSLSQKYVCIPIEEIEAWFLADPEAIKKTFKIRKSIKIKGNPETIKSPKEYLEDLVYRTSNKSFIYNNVKHNAKLASNLDLRKLISSCESFEKLHSYLSRECKF